MKILFFANTDWYLFHFRLGLAEFLREKGYEVVMMSPPGEYGPKLTEAGFRWIALPMDRKSLNPIRESKLLYRICRICKKEHPDIVHNFTIKCVIYGSLAARITSIQRRINAITGLGHVFISNSLKARMLRPVVKQLLRCALRGSHSYLIVQNPDDQQLVTALGLIAGDHIHLIKGSGVDTDSFLPVPRKRKSCFRVLLASRLLQEKGIQTFIDAARLLNDRKNEIQFLLAGISDPGNPSAVSNDLLTDWRHEGLVEVLGHVEDMHELLKNVDLVVLPSHREGVPRSLIEAASMQLPVITTDVPGCREIVEHGINGFLIPLNDNAALAGRILDLYDNPELCRRFGRAGRIKVEKEFNQEIVFSQTWNVYTESQLSP